MGPLVSFPNKANLWLIRWCFSLGSTSWSGDAFRFPWFLLLPILPTVVSRSVLSSPPKSAPIFVGTWL